MSKWLTLAAIALTAATPPAQAYRKLLPNYSGAVFMGDSITWEWVLEQYFPNATNEGVGAQTCAQQDARFALDVMARRPKVVVLLCGTDDIRYYVENNQTALFDMVQKAEAGGAKVIVGTLPPNDGWGWALAVPGAITKERADFVIWNNGVRAMAKSYGYRVVDYNTPMLLNGLQNTALFQQDLTHPNAAGYGVMAAALRPILNEDMNIAE